MKKVILMFACIAGFALASFAQTKEDITTQRANSIEQVVTGCKTASLDEKEIQKVKEIIQNLHKKQDQIKADTSLTAEAKAQKFKEANAEKDWKIKNAMGDKYMAYVDARKKMAADAAAKKQ